MKRTKFLSGAGSLIVGFILLVLIIVLTVSFSTKAYDKLTEDRELVVSNSPDQNHTIKVKVKGTLSFDDPTVVISETPIEVYCGKVGSDLQKYSEFSGSDQYKMDFFLFTWDDEQHVTIAARENNKNEAVDTMKIEFK